MRITRKSAVLLAVWLAGQPVFADTVVLKSGERVEGTVVQTDGKKTVIETNGVEITYWADEIEDVASGATALVQNAPDKIRIHGVLGDTYDQLETSLGNFDLTGPQGWEKETDVGFGKDSIAFLFYAKNKDKVIPSICLQCELVDQQIASVMEYAGRLKSMFTRDMPLSIELAGPQLTVINGRDFAVLTMTDSKEGVKFQWSRCLENGLGITVQYASTIEEYDQDYPLYQQVLQSFVKE